MKSEPFSIAWAGSVYAKVQAVNAYGSSIESVAGNGARLQTNPSAPISLIEVVTIRTNTTITITWSADFNGGSQIIDYNIAFD